MVLMSDPSDEEGAESNVDHGLGDVDALFVVTDEASPAGHPSEGSFNHPSARQDGEAFGSFDATDDLDGELQESGLVHQLCPVIGAVGEEMLYPGPALADRIQDL